MEILHKYAKNINGNVIHIGNAQINEKYFCPECEGDFILKSGNIRQRHFAHKNFSPNCTREGYLHKTFKKLFLEWINHKIINNISLNIVMRCNYCGFVYNLNILPRNSFPKEEYDLKVCRPDIALLDHIRRSCNSFRNSCKS